MIAVCVVAVLWMVLAGWLVGSEPGRDRLALWAGRERLEVDEVVGADAGSAAPRGLFVYRVGERVVLGPSREAVRAACGAWPVCVTGPHRIVGLGARQWAVMMLPAWLAPMHRGGCEHGEAAHEGDEASRAARIAALRGATVYVAGLQVEGERVRLVSRVFGGQPVIAMFTSQRLASGFEAEAIAFERFLALYQPGLPARVDGGSAQTFELSVEELVEMKSAG
jgi:hypothetical protein